MPSEEYNSFIEPKLVSKLTVASVRPTYWMLSNKDGWLVKINIDTGEIEFGPNYTPDEAAKTFWEAVGRYGCP